MIAIDNVTFTHDHAAEPSLRDVTLHIPRGQCVLLCGPSGSGKTTLTRLINGLIPHYYEGRMEGRVRVGDLDVTTAALHQTARVVGSVFQNPRSQFFCVDTTSELAFACENMGMPEEQVIERVRTTTQEMGIQDLTGRSLFALSGGEKQKIACGSVHALSPDVVVLDEPTSNLDLPSIDDLRCQLIRWKDQGKTVVIAEHRLYWLSDVCDRVVCMRDGSVSFDMPMAEFAHFTEDDFESHGLRSLYAPTEFVPMDALATDDKSLRLRGLRYAYGTQQALDIGDLELPANEVTAVVGPNGAGKSTLARCVCGQLRTRHVVCEIAGQARRRRQLAKCSYMVMQDVNHQLFCETVQDELCLGTSASEREVADMLEALDLARLAGRHPMSLSGGQKQRVAVAAALLSGKDTLVFDEPTSGMDFTNMELTASLIRSLHGRANVLVVTHDPELVSRCCTNVLALNGGHVSHCSSNSSGRPPNLRV